MSVSVCDVLLRFDIDLLNDLYEISKQKLANNKSFVPYKAVLGTMTFMCWKTRSVYHSKAPIGLVFDTENT